MQCHAIVLDTYDRHNIRTPATQIVYIGNWKRENMEDEEIKEKKENKREKSNKAKTLKYYVNMGENKPLPPQIYYYCCTRYVEIKRFFLHIGIFSLPAAGLFSCSRLQGTQGARPNTTAQVGALAEVRGTWSGGFKSQVPAGRHSEHVEPSRPMQTQKMSEGSSCDI